MSFSASAAAFRRGNGFYFGDEAPQPKRVNHKPTESSADLLGLPQIKTPTSNDADINPYAYAMASIYNRSHPNSRSNTPAPSRPSSVHREPAKDEEINPYAYAMGSIYKRSHSRSRSTTPAQSRAASVHEESKEGNKSLVKMWRRSFSRTPSAQNSRASSVHRN